MKFGTFHQQICLAFVIGSTIASLACDYLWAFHFAPYDPKFPTPASVLELSISISAFFVFITTGLFAVTLLIALGSAAPIPTNSHRLAGFALGLIVQISIFVSPHAITGANPILGVLAISPVVAALTFTRLRDPNPGVDITPDQKSAS